MRLLILALVAGAIGVPMILIASAFAATETTVADVPIEDGGIQRVLLVSTPSPKAALIMLPGGNGMVDFGPDGAFRRMAGSFLLRTLPLWQAQGFAVAVLTPPNGMSLLG
jgi:hypothetical protein